VCSGGIFGLGETDRDREGLLREGICSQGISAAYLQGRGEWDNDRELFDNSWK